MSRASRRAQRVNAKRANNAKAVSDNAILRQHYSSESKQDRIKRMQELYRQHKSLGEKS